MSALKQMMKKVENETHDLAPSRVHGFLEICMMLTGRGEVEDDYIKAINYPIGEISIYSDPYYNQVTMYSKDEDEMELDEDDMNRLADELKKRILSFERRIRKKRKEVSEKVFDEALDFISFDQ